ncbi:bis(5'-nucleosyl)-tetraphosphatase (symmetrical) YqeK [Psychromonas antarctica]|uniref:bis(5'-nucleosyl)-tetraphosphatase (symmetrical) YqeK n=1 Tax=Psychromonas antarctica TaxID=67573 RepID=UPI001EE8AF6B|nr:bis(5'-nucleosyl)-tetraphosphatase (symmetrical) YqeK [Psychromonas antarctica]MCG6201837.1 bis(5'-nucleosyl)-tetraphosphatase (symmetrical) YqeK [Psychromonas antarctica]
MKSLNKKEFDKLREVILPKIKKQLIPKRYEHTLNVEKTAIALAEKHNGKVYDIALAALLHDNAKNFSDEEKLALCKKYHIELSKTEEINIDLVHAKLGGVLAEDDYHVENQDIINAIKYHTTGRPNMSMTEKIIYIADFIEPGRKDFPGLIEARKLADENLDAALISILSLTINYVMDRGLIIDPTTEETYEYYRKKQTPEKEEKAHRTD